MIRLVMIIMTVVVTLGAITACYNKEPKGATSATAVR
jgi:hypothetical protein